LQHQDCQNVADRSIPQALLDLIPVRLALAGNRDGISAGSWEPKTTGTNPFQLSRKLS
jgi:hypothetical protein